MVENGKKDIQIKKTQPPCNNLREPMNSSKMLQSFKHVKQKRGEMTMSPFRPASQCTISRWIVTAIRSVPGGWPATEDPIRAPDVRGVAAS